MEEKNTEVLGVILDPRKNKSRKWSITFWAKPVFDEKQMKYMVIGRELCPKTGREHWQGFVYWHNAKSFDQVQKYLAKRVSARIVPSNGSIDENIAYCTKDEDYEEFGERPAQGQRKDLESLAKDISEGLTVDEIILERPVMYHQYGRTLNKLEDLAMMQRYRNFMTKGTWYYGPTGVGKSHLAFDNFHPNTHYVVPMDNGWWDGYRQQDTVILNDFRGSIPYDEILQMVDKWPYYVKRRNRQPIPFISKHVIVTSSLSPEDIYNRRNEKDSIDQLRRRFEIFIVSKECIIEDRAIAYFN